MKNDKVKCSIIVPIYNAEHTLSRCINSLISQDYENIEIILVNDGSTDCSLNICEEFAFKDNRIVLISKPNAGSSAARNTGLDAATGDYIFFADSDDWVESSFCSNVVKIFNEYSVDVVIFGFKEIVGNKIKEKHSKTSGLIDKEEVLKGTLIDGYINSLVWNKAFKADIYDGTRFPLGNSFDDVGTAYKLIGKSNSFYISSASTYNYEIRNGSLSSKWWHSDKKLDDYFDVRLAQLEYFKSNYPSLEGEAFATTGFAAVMGIVFYSGDNKRFAQFLSDEKINLIQSAFPYMLLFRLFYKFPSFAKRLLKTLFR